MKRILSAVLVLAMLFALVPAVTIGVSAEDGVTEDRTQEPVVIKNGEYEFTINKTVFEVGEPILVSAKGPLAKDWVGIYKGSEGSSIYWNYVDSVGDGVEYNLISSVAGRITEGEYLVRLMANDSDNDVDTKAIVKIRVGNPETGVKGDKTALSTDKAVYKVGEPIMVTATAQGADSWVGFYRYNQYNKASYRWHWVDKPNKGYGEYSAGSGVAFDVTQGTEILPGYYTINLFPDSATNWNAVVASTSVFVEGDYAVTYETMLGGGDNGGTTTPDTPDTPDKPDTPDTPDTPTPEAGVTFEESGSAVKLTNGEYELSVNKTVFEVGEPILISAKGPNAKDWVGLYRVQDNASIMYQFVDSVGDGAWFDITKNYIEGGCYNQYSSLPEGEYVIRLQADDSNNFDGSRALIKIKIGNPQEKVFGNSALLSTDKAVYKPGEPIMVTPYMVEGYADSWIGIYQFDNYYKNASTAWEWVKTAGSGVAYDITEGKTLKEGVYLIRLVPYDTADMTTTVAYTMVTVCGDTAVSYDSFISDKTVGVAPTNGVTVSNDTHSMTVNKTKYELGEEIIVSAIGTDSRDWIGIAQRGYKEATILWYYISSVGNGEPYDIKTAPNVGGNLGHLKDIPEGLYTIYLVEKDGYLKNGYTFSINISVGDVSDPDNGKTEGGTEVDAPSGGVMAPIGATYTPFGNGYAGGTVTVTMPTEALNSYDIVMYWADANGVLEGYSSHARFKVTSTIVNYTIPKSVIIPKEATRLLVYAQRSSTGELSSQFVSIDLPEGSQMDITSNKVTSFFAISDVHIGSANGAKHFKLMLAEAIALYPNGVPIYVAGDVTDNGNEGQYVELMALYGEVLSAYGKSSAEYPLYLAIGNHDYPSAYHVFLEYATLPDGTHPTDTCYDFWLDGYHYIFLGSDSPSGLNSYFSAETLAWLDSTLAECRDTSRPIFIFLHQPMYNTVSGSLPGEGWHGVSNEDEFKTVISKYPEIVMFNGHTHWEMNSVGNAFDGTEELPIHIYNCASVSYLWSGYNKVTGENMYGSHGYAVDVYEDRVVIRGRDFVNSLWIASAQYSFELQESQGNCHDYQMSGIEYKNGYMQKGTKVYTCTNCGATKEESVSALFTFSGYSLCTYNTAYISAGYTIDFDALSQYEEYNNTSISVGFVIAAYDNLVNAGKPMNADGTVGKVTSGSVIKYEPDGIGKYFDVVVQSSSWEAYKHNKIVMCAYIIEGDSVGYICQGDTASALATPITYAELLQQFN